MHNFRIVADFALPAVDVLALAREFDLVSSWNWAVTDSQILTEYGDMHIDAYAVLRMPWPFANRRAVLTAEGGDCLDEAGCATVLMQSTDIAAVRAPCLRRCSCNPPTLPRCALLACNSAHAAHRHCRGARSLSAVRAPCRQRCSSSPKALPRCALPAAANRHCRGARALPATVLMQSTDAASARAPCGVRCHRDAA